MTLQEDHPLIRCLDQAFRGPSWHGTTLKGALRGLDVRTASWRPGTGRRSIWDLVLHCAYWKYTVRRRLRGEKRGSFPREGSDFPTPSGSDERSWKADVRLLTGTHREMREAILDLSPAEFDRKLPGSTVTPFALVSGVIAHDLHHGGQIQLLNRLAPRSGKR